MDQKNDYRIPRDRITGEFLSEIFLENDDIAGSGSAPANEYISCTANFPSTCKRRSDETVTHSFSTSSKNKSSVSLEGSYSLAMAYVPWQEFEDLFCEEEGFSQGTIFKKLRFPFFPTPCRKEGDCK